SAVCHSRRRFVNSRSSCSSGSAQAGHTLIRDAHAGYITWAEYEENLRRLHNNAQACGADRRHGPPREGPALLQGLAVCGRCGGLMTIRYYISHSEVLPEYVCQREG